MNKNFLYLLGGAGISGLVYYIYSRNRTNPRTPEADASKASPELTSRGLASQEELRNLYPDNNYNTEHSDAAENAPDLMPFEKMFRGEVSVEPGFSMPISRQFYPAQFIGPKRNLNKIRLIIIHCTASDKDGANIAKYFNKHTPNKTKEGKDIKTSAHYVVGDDGIYRCVEDDNVAYAVGPKDPVAISIEVVGKGDWSEDKWMERSKTIDNTARLVADLAVKYKIPIVPLRIDDLSYTKDGDKIDKGNRGITTHLQVSKAFSDDGHGDPGPNFPYTYMIQKAQGYLAQKLGQKTEEDVEIDEKLLADLITGSSNTSA